MPKMKGLGKWIAFPNSREIIGTPNSQTPIPILLPSNMGMVFVQPTVERGPLKKSLKYGVMLCTPPKTNMTMGNPPFEDVFPIENGDFQLVMLVFSGVSSP